MLQATMDAQQALADLTEISSQIQAAVVFDDTGIHRGQTSWPRRRVGSLPPPRRSRQAGAR